MTTDVDLPPAARAVLEETDWGSLRHARGMAWDLPAVLVRLLDEDPAIRRDAFRKLEDVGGRFSAHTSTARVALFLAAILEDPRTLARETAPPTGPRDGGRSWRAELLTRIAGIALVASDSRHQCRERCLDACRAVRPELYAKVTEFLGDPDPDVREAAAEAAVALADDLRLAERLLAGADLPHAARALLEDVGRDSPELVLVGRVPDLLTLLLHENAEVRAAAFHRLNGNGHGRSAFYLPPVPVVLFLAAILNEPRTALPVPCGRSCGEKDREPLRALLLTALGEMAERSCQGSLVKPSDERAAFRSALPALYGATSPSLKDTDGDVRHAALNAARHMLKATVLADRLPEATRLLRAALAGSEDRAERVSLTRCLAEWGQSTADLLADADPAVRACAALTPANAADPRSTRVIMETLADPEAVESWHLTRPSWSFGFPTLVDLLKAVVERAETFDDLFPVLLPTLPYLVSESRGQRQHGLPGLLSDELLARMFPDGLERVTELDPAQWGFLSALTELLGSPEETIRWFDGHGSWDDEWADEHRDAGHLRRILTPFHA